MLKTRQRSSGFTLLELLVTLTIVAILLAVFVNVFSTAVQKYKTAVITTRLDQSLQAALSVMANDIRRNGFWGNASSDIGTMTNTNPFAAADISINGGANCILLSYDQNGDGLLPSIGSGTDDERYGYRLMNSAIQYRPSGASYSCAAAAGAWNNLTDSTVLQISALSFVQSAVSLVIASPATPTMTVRSIVISVTGNLTAFPSVTKTLTEQVKIRNDNYAP